MSVISDIEALRHLREPSYSKRVGKIVNAIRDFNDELLQLRDQVKTMKRELDWFRSKHGAPYEHELEEMDRG